MYVYLDGFGAAPPQPVPEQASILLLGSGLVGLALALFALVWVVGPRVVEWSARLANLLRG